MGGKDERYCLICGGFKRPDGSVDSDLRCTPRLESQKPAPEPKRRQYACEDADVISVAVLGLEQQRLAARNAINE